MSELRKDFEDFLKKDFPTAFKYMNNNAIDSWIEFGYSCYLEGQSKANKNSLKLIEMLEEKYNGN